ncbi:MAG: PEP-CTERM sorting domain-containing protein [Armatimonadetes bacterium]|nr:PEP-CTERM sorting domain-containing protein [Armatimonadota bacterium]
MRTRNLLTFATLITVAHAQASTFFDGTFNSGDYTLDVFSNTGNNTTNNFFGSGGNPDAYMQIFESIFPTIDPSIHFVSAIASNSTWVWDPSTDGAIDSLDISGDVRTSTLTILSLPITIRQGGNIYFGGASAGFLPPKNIWHNAARTGMLASDFGKIKADGSYDFGSEPDFSASGGVMTFGVGMFLSPGILPNGSHDDLDMDNVSIDVHTAAVPEPGTIALAAGGLAFLRRRRRAG